MKWGDFGKSADALYEVVFSERPVLRSAHADTEPLAQGSVMALSSDHRTQNSKALCYQAS